MDTVRITRYAQKLDSARGSLFSNYLKSKGYQTLAKAWKRWWTSKETVSFCIFKYTSNALSIWASCVWLRYHLIQSAIMDRFPLSILSRGHSRNNAEEKDSPAATGCCIAGQSCVGKVIICRSGLATFPELAGPWWSCSLSLAWWKPSRGPADMETRMPKATCPFWHPADRKTCP